MKVLFAPGIEVMHRLPNMLKMPLVALLFLLPLGVLYFEIRASVSAALSSWLAALLGIALYAMVSFYIQARSGWNLLMPVIQRISGGDLTGKFTDTPGGHFGAALKGLELVTHNIGRLVSEVRASSEAVLLSANEIAAGNSNLSQRTEQQASTLEETASGMEELSGTVTQNADNCKLASGLAQNAERVARQGAQAVHGVVEGMGKIDQSSKRISDIIGVIEGIAFQTNILALNAAVEAARAGEQGRGFAVVAGEVRALAQRSADAAKEIKTLIQASVEQISNGSRGAEGAGKVIDEIVVSVQQVNELIGEIAVASAEQSAGVGEINKAILQLESVTQQNAALVEEASASSLTFQEQADRLRHLVARFKVTEETPMTGAHKAAPRTAPAPKASAARAILPHSEARAAIRSLPKRPVARAAAAAAAGAARDDDEWKEF